MKDLNVLSSSRRVRQALHISNRSFGSNLYARASRRSATSKVRLHCSLVFSRSWKVAETKVRTVSWSSDDSVHGARGREIRVILDQICRALPRDEGGGEGGKRRWGEAKSRSGAVTEISREWFSRGARDGSWTLLFSVTYTRIRELWIGLWGGLSRITPAMTRIATACGHATGFTLRVSMRWLLMLMFAEMSIRIRISVHR